MKAATYLLILLCLLTFSACMNQHENRTIFKSDFEGDTLNYLKQWNETRAYKVDSCQLGLTNNSHSGTKAFKISRVWCDAWSRAGIETSSLIRINPNKKYLLKFWCKTENLVEYSLPITVRFKVFRKEHEPLNYSKNISWSEFEWRKNFLLLENLPNDCDSFQLQIYTRFRTKGSIFIDDIEIKEASNTDIENFENWRRQKIPAPLGNAELVSKKDNGFFNVHKSNDRWWLLKPDGKVFWTIGTMAAMPGNSGNGNIGLYNWYKEHYPDNPNGFANMLFDTLQSWGFNSYAGWTSDYFAQISANNHKNGKEYFPMFRVLSLSRMGKKDYYAKDKWGEVKDGDHAMVDPFNPKWRMEAKQKAMELIPEYREKPWFVGWYVDNEINLNDLFKFVWADYSSIEFVKLLKEKYLIIENVNKQWSSTFGKYNFTSFEEIIISKPEPKDWDDPLFIDFALFERMMVKEYIDFTYNIVKEFDPNHIVISNRIHLGPMSDLHRTMDLWGKYDLICMNIYPENLKFGFSPGELEIMNKLHRMTGKPVIIGEWSIPAIGPELYGFGTDPFDRPLDWSWPQVVRNQKERGEIYNACMMQLASMDFIIGAGWFKPIDVNSPTRRANRGLINGNFEPYKEMVDAMKKTNTKISDNLNLEFN